MGIKVAHTLISKCQSADTKKIGGYDCIQKAVRREQRPHKSTTCLVPGTNLRSNPKWAEGKEMRKGLTCADCFSLH